MATKIYTKTGDGGSTGLIGGERIDKTHVRIASYGTVDELNSYVGVVRAELTLLKSQSNLESFCQQMEGWMQQIQNTLFNLGSHLACTDDKVLPTLPAMNDHCTTALEEIIDECSPHLPELKEFVLPGGGPIGAHLHYCRTLCRRSERAVLQLKQAQEEQGQTWNPSLHQYLNRLSDLFFVLARFANYQQGFSDIPWKKN